MIYEILADDDFLILTKLVNDRLDEGWECLGGIVNGAHVFLQTMTHETLDKEIFMENLNEIVSKIKRY